MNKIILVDEFDNEVGSEEKLRAHELGLLHRAFSIFIFNSQKELLLQKRADSKYHSGGLWTNTCCSHPSVGESLETATHRRLIEEMGFDCEIKDIFSLIYKAPFSNGLTEYELDHVFIGISDKLPQPNPEEVGDYKYISMEDLIEDTKANPQNYTAWMNILIEKHKDKIQEELELLFS